MSIPIYIIISTIIYFTEGRPIFFKSHRYISSSKKVSILKFRSMIKDASSEKYGLQENFMQDGFLNIPLKHEVYTPIGRIIEKFQIVELPQLYNVIRDGMCLVGNRPLPYENLKQFEENNISYKERFYSPSGLTGISQIVNKHKISAKQRLKLEKLYSKIYLEGYVVSLDIKIIFFTILYIFFAKELNYEDAKLMLKKHL